MARLRPVTRIAVESESELALIVARLRRGAALVAGNWQVIVAAAVMGVAMWLWVLHPESDVTAGRLSRAEYMAYADRLSALAAKTRLPRGARRRAIRLHDALVALRCLETVHGIPDEPGTWGARESLAEVRRELAILKRDYPRDVEDVISEEPRELLLVAVEDYRTALRMKSPTPEAWRELEIGLAEALAELGRHAEAVGMLRPMARILRHNEMDALRREISGGVGEPVRAEMRLSDEEMRVHMSMARSLRALGLIEEAERHYGFVAEGGSGNDRVEAILGVGDLAVMRALKAEPREAGALDRAAESYREVFSGVQSVERRLSAGFRLGGVLLAGARPAEAAEVFAQMAAFAGDVAESRRAELMHARCLVAGAKASPDGGSASGAPGAERADQMLEALVRKGPADPTAAAARAVLGELYLSKGELDSAWAAFQEVQPARSGEPAAPTEAEKLGLGGPGDVLRPEAVVSDLHELAAGYSAVRRHERAIEVYEYAVRRWSADARTVGAEIAREADLLVAAAAAAAGSAEPGSPARAKAEDERGRWLVRAAAEYIALAGDRPTRTEEGRALLAAAERLQGAGRLERAAEVYGAYADRFGQEAESKRARHEMGVCLAGVGRYRDAVIAFRRNAWERFWDETRPVGTGDPFDNVPSRSPYGYLSHFEWGNTLLKWGKLSGDSAGPVEAGQGGPPVEPRIVRGARQVFEEILADARYSPESLVWMKSIFRLGQVYLALADAEAMKALDDPARSEAAQELYGRAVSTLGEALERYRLEKFRARRDVTPEFYAFLSEEEMPATEALALAHFGLGEYAEAMRFLGALRAQLDERYSQSAEAAPAEGLSAREKNALIYSGLCHYRLGLAATDAKEAEARFRDALAAFSEARDKLLQEPESAWVRHGMALCYERLGMFDAAARSYRDAEWAYQNVAEEPRAPSGLGREFWKGRNMSLREALEWKEGGRTSAEAGETEAAGAMGGAAR